MALPARFLRELRVEATIAEPRFRTQPIGRSKESIGSPITSIASM